MNPFRPISISLSPNTEKDDIFLAFKLLFQPWRWKTISVNQRTHQRQSASTELEEKFQNYLGVKCAISFNSGRSALLAILKNLDLNEKDEVLLQAFTCNAAVNPIIWSGVKPVFVDCNEKTLNIDIEDLKRKITSRSGVVMVQHTFGLPAEMDEILKICRQNNLILIEDCAHSLGAKYSPPHQSSQRKWYSNFSETKSVSPFERSITTNFAEIGGGVKKFCGTFGDVAFFSFGRDKIISSVFGGMVVTNDDKIGERIKSFQAKLSFPSNFWIFQQLLHPILTNFLVLPAYGINQNLGRLIIGFFHQLSILSKAVYKKEKKGEIPKYFPKRLPNALANLALNQFKKLERFNEHRRKIAKFYEENLKEKFEMPLAIEEKNILPTFMRYPILVKNDTTQILKEARKRKIYLDDGWRKSPIVPPDTNLEKMKYTLGSCPQAEKIAKSILNLPTHINISKKEAQRIVEFLNSCK